MHLHFPASGISTVGGSDTVPDDGFPFDQATKHLISVACDTLICFLEELDENVSLSQTLRLFCNINLQHRHRYLLL